MQNKRFGAITSSQSPDDIANTIKGLTLSLSAIIILVAQQFFHVALSANDILSFGTELGIAGGSVWTLYGLGMKVWAYFFRTA